MLFAIIICNSYEVCLHVKIFLIGTRNSEINYKVIYEGTYVGIKYIAKRDTTSQKTSRNSFSDFLGCFWVFLDVFRIIFGSDLFWIFLRCFWIFFGFFQMFSDIFWMFLDFLDVWNIHNIQNSIDVGYIFEKK